MTVFSSLNGPKIRAFKNAVSSYIPSSVIVPLQQEKGKSVYCLVKPGDLVTEGQLLAASKTDISVFSSNVYSPVPGRVEDIVMTKCPDGTYSEAVKIRFGGTFSFLGKPKKELSLSTLTSQMLVRSICDAGILNTFVTSLPVLLATDIQNSIDSKSEFVVVRLFDDDPSRLTDSLITKLFFSQVVEGSRIAAKASGAKKIVFVCDVKSKKYIEDGYLKCLPAEYEETFVFVNKRKYPIGLKHQLCNFIKTQKKESDFEKIDENALYVDSSSMHELFRTVKFGMPVLDRYIYVNGDCLHASGLLRVPVGTSFSFIAEEYGKFKKKPAAVIINGLLNGFSSSDIDVPVTKYCKSINFLTVAKTPDQRVSVCIRCGNCRRACPRGLSPDILFRHITGGLQTNKIYLDSTMLCDNCGLCSSVCPARLPLGQQITDFIEKSRKVK